MASAPPTLGMDPSVSSLETLETKSFLRVAVWGGPLVVAAAIHL